MASISSSGASEKKEILPVFVKNLSCACTEAASRIRAGKIKNLIFIFGSFVVFHNATVQDHIGAKKFIGTVSGNQSLDGHGAAGADVFVFGMRCIHAALYGRHLSFIAQKNYDRLLVLNDLFYGSLHG